MWGISAQITTSVESFTRPRRNGGTDGYTWANDREIAYCVHLCAQFVSKVHGLVHALFLGLQLRVLSYDKERTKMLQLGHISSSNYFPLNAMLLKLKTVFPFLSHDLFEIRS